MNEEWADMTIIRAPRSPGIMLLQFFSAVPLGVALMLFIAVVSARPHVSYASITALIFIVIVPGGIASILIFWLPQRYVTLLNIDCKNKLLTKTKRGDGPVVFDLSEINRIVLIKRYTNPTTECAIVFEDGHGERRTVVAEDTASLYGRYWDMVANELSHTTNLPLQKELWTEDKDGKLVGIPEEKAPRVVVAKLVLAAAPLAATFAGALVFSMRPTLTAFFVVGAFTVLASFGISFTYMLTNRENLGDSERTQGALLVSSLLMIVPFSFYYLCFVFLVNGFSLHFGR